jgi:hypothetical protein
VIPILFFFDEIIKIVGIPSITIIFVFEKMEPIMILKTMESILFIQIQIIVGTYLLHLESVITISLISNIVMHFK